jgi:hypothetical protein
MKIQGNLATYELSDLLQWLAQGNKTGLLTVSDGSLEYKLGFDHGRIDMSSSSDPQQRLDTHLHRRGVIDQTTLDRANRLRDATKMMSGQVLVTLGAVSEQQGPGDLRVRRRRPACLDHGADQPGGHQAAAREHAPARPEPGRSERAMAGGTAGSARACGGAGG